MKFLMLFIILSVSVSAKPAVKEGKHSLTLQWIEGKGSINFVKKGKSEFEVSGEQKSSKTEDFLKMEGVIQVRSSTELEFTGKIETQVSYINDGKVCLRDGKHTFKAYGKRKYWRMQDKINCDGKVTDYIDIYFQ